MMDPFDGLEPDGARGDGRTEGALDRMATGPWFVRFAGRRSGPFDAERLRIMARRKALTRMHSVSADGTTWVPATSIRSVFNPDGSVVSGPVLSLEPDAAAPADRFGDLPDSGPIGPPSAPRAAHRGSALARPAVIAALALASIVLALPTSRDSAGAVCWWWGEGPVSLTMRGLAVLAVLGGWVLVFLPCEPARAASVSAAAALLAASAAVPVAGWAPWCAAAAPLVAFSAVLVAVESAGGRSLRGQGLGAAIAGAVFGLGSAGLAAFDAFRDGASTAPGVLAIVGGVLALGSGAALVFAGTLAWRAVPNASTRIFWWSVAGATAGMAAVFASAFAGLSGDEPMQGAQAAVAACIALAFATQSWSSAHEAIENMHRLPSDDEPGAQGVAGGAA